MDQLDDTLMQQFMDLTGKFIDYFRSNPNQIFS